MLTFVLTLFLAAFAIKTQFFSNENEKLHERYFVYKNSLCRKYQHKKLYFEREFFKAWEMFLFEEAH